MDVRYRQCDGCGLACDKGSGKYANGKGSLVDLCDQCVRKIVLKSLKSNMFVLRAECRHCGGTGIQLYQNKDWLPCGHCGN